MNSKENLISELVAGYGNVTQTNGIFIPGETNIPVSGKVIDAEEIKYMIEASLDAWLTTGRFNKEFEKELALFLGAKHLITVNSG